MEYTPCIADGALNQALGRAGAAVIEDPNECGMTETETVNTARLLGLSSTPSTTVVTRAFGCARRRHDTGKGHLLVEVAHLVHAPAVGAEGSYE